MNTNLTAIELSRGCDSSQWIEFLNFADDVGAWGVVGRSLESAAKKVGLRGTALRNLVRESGIQAAYFFKMDLPDVKEKGVDFRNVEP